MRSITQLLSPILKGKLRSKRKPADRGSG